MILKGCSGFGDAIYVDSIASYLSKEKKKEVGVVTRYPKIFEKSGDVSAIHKWDDWKKLKVTDISYVSERGKPGSIYDNMLKKIGLTSKECPLKLGHEPIPYDIDFIKQKICVIKVPSKPSWGAPEIVDIIPSENIFKKIIDIITEKGYQIVAVGKKAESVVEPPEGCIDLRDKTPEYYDILRIVACANLVFTQTGFLLPIAESLAVPAIGLVGGKARTSKDDFTRMITPEKVHCAKTSRCYYDDDKGVWGGIEEIA